jgi:hypothetical protein
MRTFGAAIRLARLSGVPSPETECVCAGVLLWARARELTLHVAGRSIKCDVAEWKRGVMAQELYEWRTHSGYTPDRVTCALVLRAFYELANAMRAYCGRVLVHRDSSVVASEEPDVATEATAEYAWLLSELCAPAGAPRVPAPTEEAGKRFGFTIEVARSAAPPLTTQSVLLIRAALIWSHARALARVCESGALTCIECADAQVVLRASAEHWHTAARNTALISPTLAMGVAFELVRDAIAIMARTVKGHPIDLIARMLAEPHPEPSAEVLREAAWFFAQVTAPAA